MPLFFCTMEILDLRKCVVCPRECGVNRYNGAGYCGAGAEMRVAKTMLHKFEEPCISGGDVRRGSGAIFFSGCNLRCVYCQNGAISRASDVGEIYSSEKLAEEMLRLEASGAYNINLVTPTHYIPQIISALDIAKKRLTVPVVFNTGGYEKAETIAALDGYADIFLTDFKYGDGELAKKYSAAENYPEVAKAALSEMYRITGEVDIGDDGIMRRGIIIRHLVLPGGRRDSVKALETVASTLDTSKVLLSLMRQYTPEFAPESIKQLRRRVTAFEYDFVLDAALELGFDGFMQGRESARTIYTPDFK